MSYKSGAGNSFTNSNAKETHMKWSNSQLLQGRIEKMENTTNRELGLKTDICVVRHIHVITMKKKE